MSATGAFPQHFGKFVLTSLLARGGMSQVLLAKSEGVYGFRRLVVVKRMLPVLAEDQKFVSMFLREAQLGSRLQHPNIVQIFDWGQVGSQLYIAMEFVDGLDLRVALGRLRHEKRTLPLPLALYVTCEICRGLDYAHRAKDEAGNPLGIVHRDVSPSNVIVSRDGAIKVGDFGIAIGAQDAVSAPVSIRGKYAYMSPELATGASVDARSDLFSVGLLLWELVTGQRLYRADTEIATMELAQRAQMPPLPARLVLPQRDVLQGILTRVLSRDPGARFGTALELRRALIDYGKTAGIEGGAEELAAVLDETCAAELRRRGQRRDGLPVDDEPTPATPTTDAPGDATARGRAYVPVVSHESVSLPEQFPVVESRPTVEQAEIVSRPAVSRAAPIAADRVPTPKQTPRSPTPPPEPPPVRAKGPLPPSSGAPVRSAEDTFLDLLRTRLGLDETTLDKARARAAQDGVSLARGVLAERLAEESAMCHVLSEAWALPTVDLSSWTIAPELAAHLAASVAQAWEIVPFRLEKVRNRATLCVAIVEPEARMVEPEIDLRGSVQRVKFFLARRSAIQAAFVRLYHGVDRPIPPLYPKGMSEKG